MGGGEGWKKVLQEACISWMLYLMKRHREFDAGGVQSGAREARTGKRDLSQCGAHSSAIAMHCR